jgi:phytoene dehydrogenase-like protein
LTISTHIHHRRPEASLRGKAAAAWKALAAAEIQNVLRRQVAEFAGLDFMFLQNGGPRTFEKYTGRVDGLLGGLPLDRSLFPFRFPRPVTRFDGLYFLGDTVFPGQGLPGVTLGALSLYKRLHVHASRNHV